MEAKDIIHLISFVAGHKRQTGNFPEFLIVLPDHSIRTATWGMGTILVGAYGGSLHPEQWPTHFVPLPTYLELLDDQR